MPLGLENEIVLASDMTASSTYSELNKDFSATQGRLNNQPRTLSGIEYQGSKPGTVRNKNSHHMSKFYSKMVNGGYE